MKKITNKEIIDKFEKLFNSYTDEEFSKIIEEEYERIKIKDKKSLEWLNEESKLNEKSQKIVNNISNVEFKETIENKKELKIYNLAEYKNITDGNSDFLDDDVLGVAV